MPRLDILGAVLLNGISFAMLLFLLAAGLELMFGVMKIVNLAHGAFYMMGAYVAIIVVEHTDSFILGVLAGMAVGALLGVFTEKLFFSRVPDHLQQVLLTFGIVYILIDVCRALWGGNPLGISIPQSVAGSIPIGGMLFPVYRLVVIVIGCLIALSLWYFQEKTLLGAIIRAGVDDKEMVATLGINIGVLNTAVFALGSLLAGLAGVLGSPVLFVYPRVSWDILIFSMMVVVVGGMGSLRGALLGSLLIGLSDTLGKLFLPSGAMVLTFSVMVVFLVIKPSGIFGAGNVR